MPLYEYRCRECGHRFEVLQRLGEGAESLECPRCGAGRPERALSTFATASATASAAGSARPTGGCGAPACGSGFT
jgi:putative FmdB family regulatory protein